MKTPRAQLAQDLVFETADGYLTTGAVSDAEWLGLARATGHPEWLDDELFATPAGRAAQAAERLDLVAQVLAERTNAEWLERLDAEKVPCAPVLSRDELLDHPQIVANEMIVEGEHPHPGPMRQARPAARFERTPAAGAVA